MGADSERASRAGANEALFRQVNERIKELNEAFDQLTPYASWTCECPRIDCLERIELTLAEYEELRREPTHFAITPDESHLEPGVERVIQQNSRYWIVEKIGKAAEAAAVPTAEAS